MRHGAALEAFSGCRYGSGCRVAVVKAELGAWTALKSLIKTMEATL